MIISKYLGLIIDKSLIMGTAIKFVSENTFLGISIMSNDVTDHNISKTSWKFYHKANQVINDFKYLYRNIKSHYCCLAIVLMHMYPNYGIFMISL